MIKDKLECGCNGFHECSEAVRLWNEVNRQYELCQGKPSAFYRWDDYDKAIVEYRKHKNPVKVS